MGHIVMLDLPNGLEGGCGFSLRSPNSAFTLVHSCHELEQGFNIRMTGPQSRPLFDMDGLLLTSRVPQDDEPELDEEDTEDAA